MGKRQDFSRGRMSGGRIGYSGAEAEQSEEDEPESTEEEDLAELIGGHRFLLACQPSSPV